MWTDPAGYIEELTRALRLLDLDALDRAAFRLHRAYVAHRTVFTLGNGGSAAAAAHLATDLAKLTTVPGQARLKAMALVDSAATLTAAANDIAFDEVFVEQLRTFMSAGDVVVGISTSGRSRNVLRAIDYANRHGGITIGITGTDGDPLREVVREALTVASLSVQQIEDVTLVAAHLLCLLTRERCLAEPRALARDEVDELVTDEQLRLTIDVFPRA